MIDINEVVQTPDEAEIELINVIREMESRELVVQAEILFEMMTEKGATCGHLQAFLTIFDELKSRGYPSMQTAQAAGNRAAAQAILDKAMEKVREHASQAT